MTSSDRLRKFLNLTNSDRYLLLSAAFILGAIRSGMWLLSFKMLQQILTRLSQAKLEPQILEQSSVDKIVWAVNVASCYTPGHVKCLARALTTQVLLNRCGYSPELRIGVAKGDKGKFEAHAWVENQGEIVIGHLSDLVRFTPLPSFSK
ncbi:lasso peptide biosynthesis B2 protein [Nostoc sp. UCD121]|nr:lasso peptide biosynthesis B2 protein [Nostoc sp. UCD120]MBC1279560.1 lasso peptide biosynthesis B2 protein [Nostoc sp. UCD121]MBC1296459.1 lasso peptide biosynthesis B2 protein [Nostoc sp. UCD122]